MPASYRCFPPCLKSFSTTKALNAHISNKPECFDRYSQFLLALVRPATPANGPQSDAGPASSSLDTSPLGSPIDSSPQDPVGGLDALALDDTSIATESEQEQANEPQWIGVQPGMEEPPTNDEYEYVEVYPDAGRILRRDESAYEKILANIERDSPQNMYYPFASQSEWGIAVFLHNNLTLSEIDNFLRLQFMQPRRPSFGSGAALRDRIEQLPQHGPRWVARDITPNYGAPLDTPVLLYRDPVDAIKYLLARPALAEHLEFAPRKVWEDETQQSRLYSEMWTGNWWWRNQVLLPVGSTVIPVILASDKTHLTNFSGDKSAWPIYLSIGNINAKTRNAPSKGAWVTIAYLPIVQFNDEEKIRGTLSDRFFHQCCRIIFSSLIRPGVNGIHMADSYGDVRLCFPRVAAYIADYPEQLLINVACGRNSPISTATYHDLGNADPSPPRTYGWITERIREACDTVNPSLVAQYVVAARKLGLNGVHVPFWLDLPGYEPDIVVSPDLLHGGHMILRDHVLKWVRGLVGASELDKRLQVLQSVVGYRHFKQGISHLKQWSGRDDRELQRVLLAVIAGAPQVTPKVIKSIRAFQDFLYLAQYRSHSEATLEYLADALQTFHATKDVFISAGVRIGKKEVIPHFKIPKLAGLHAYYRHIPEMGSSPQYSTEITEHNHQPMAKHAYKATNRINAMEQMARYLERHEKVLLFNEFHAWHAERSRANHIDQLLHQYSPRFRAHIIPHILGTQDTEANGSSSATATSSRLSLTRKPSLSRQEVTDISEIYHLHDLGSAIETFLTSLLTHPRSTDRQVDIHYMDVWTKLRIRLPSVQSDEESGLVHVVEAVPPSTGLPYGRCHCVLVNESAEQDVGIEGEFIESSYLLFLTSRCGHHITGYRVAQVRLLFRLHLGNTGHRAHQVPLAYVQWFSRPKAVAEPNICMYQVSRLDSGGFRRGSVIPLDGISRFVQLVPKFGSVAANELTSANSMDICRDYWVNSFADKEIYQAVW